jgi:hypothetical protein
MVFVQPREWQEGSDLWQVCLYCGQPLLQANAVRGMHLTPCAVEQAVQSGQLPPPGAPEAGALLAAVTPVAASDSDMAAIRDANATLTDEVRQAQELPAVQATRTAETRTTKKEA